MPKPYDASLKDLITGYPADWLSRSAIHEHPRGFFGLSDDPDEGAIKELKKTLLRHGRKRFGPPDEAAMAALEAVVELGRLERMSERLLDVTTWDELLAAP